MAFANILLPVRQNRRRDGASEGGMEGMNSGENLTKGEGERATRATQININFACWERDRSSSATSASYHSKGGKTNRHCRISHNGAANQKPPSLCEN